MPVKSHKPTSAGTRVYVSLDYSGLDDKEPERGLVVTKNRSAGRNNQGRVTVRHRGGGSRKKVRLVDFRRDKDGVPAKVAALEYDPNRSAFIALLHYADGEKRYILAPEGLQKGQTVISGPDAPVRVGNALPIERIPLGTEVHNVELQPGKGGQLVRSAGASAQIIAKQGRYAHVRLPSGEVRLVSVKCKATIGTVSNADHKNIALGKAGRKRWRGWRPTVRGSAMGSHDHPHGGGEGKAPIGHDAPRSPWGWKTLGVKTRKKRKPSSRFIVRSRHESKKRR
ncbi:MAG: 50S ribosomal protein L2 [Armatimonadetes bacterium]|nr:50S ribosomal protein L2 [Armatimonadota bacterium]